MQDNAIKLLFIDDDVVFRDSLVSRLEKLHIDVTPIESAEEAVESLKEIDYDVILSDIRLGGMSGIDFLAHVKKKYSVITCQYSRR